VQTTYHLGKKKMNWYRKTFIWLTAGGLLLVGMIGSPSICVGHDDENWEHTDYGSVKNKHTGLEWGADINEPTHGIFPEKYIADFYYLPKIIRDGEGKIIDILLPSGLKYSGDNTDWRPPTVGEMLSAVDDGLLDHLDFTYGDDLDVKAIDDPIYDNTFGNRVYWATCLEKYQGLIRRYKFHFALEPDCDPVYYMESGAGDLIGVRGMPANHSNCPGKHAEPFVEYPECSLAIDDVAQREGNDGNTIFRFTLTRTGDLNASVVVYYETADAPDGAVAGEDYQARSGMAVLYVGRSSQTFDIIANGDSVNEPNEIFFVNISTGTVGATITDPQGIGTIRNDDRK
jgi:Calx-beta domain-containing protein